ncbi:unnamed protein product [Brassica oleracea]
MCVAVGRRWWVLVFFLSLRGPAMVSSFLFHRLLDRCRGWGCGGALKSRLWGGDEWSRGWSSPDVAFWFWICLRTADLDPLGVFPAVKLLQRPCLLYLRFCLCGIIHICLFPSAVDFGRIFLR